MLIEAGNLAVVTVGGNLFLSQFVTQYFFLPFATILYVYMLQFPLLQMLKDFFKHRQPYMLKVLSH